MPPKKRDRDVMDDEELDKDELKAMLRAAIDREADLTAKVEKQQEEFKEQLSTAKQREDALLLDRFFLGMPKDRSDHADWLYFYHNFKVLEQARAANIENLLTANVGGNHDLDVYDDGRQSNVFHLYVDSCTKLIQIFDQGLSAGDELRKPDTKWHHDSLFTVVIVSHRSEKQVPVEHTSEYLILGGFSLWWHFSPMLSLKLEPQQPAHPALGAEIRAEMRAGHSVLGSTHPEGPLTRVYPADVQDQIRSATDVEYDTVLKQVLVPDGTDQDGEPRFIKVDLDFDRMVGIRRNGTFSIGFFREP